MFDVNWDSINDSHQEPVAVAVVYMHEIFPRFYCLNFGTILFQLQSYCMESRAIVLDKRGIVLDKMGNVF